MHLDVVFLPSSLGTLAGRTGVVIDVLRATTSIATALGNGCPEILPVESPEEAMELARNFGRGTHLVGGERKGYKVEGFDLGNSPLEYSQAAVGGRKVILSTTNGTVTTKRVAAQQAKPVLLAAFLNLPAVVRRLLEAGNPATLVCAGREDRFALEDALCAGGIAAEVLKHAGWQGTDSARAAVALWEKTGGPRLAKTMAATEHGAYLASIGFAEDVAVAAQVGTLDLVPVYRDGRIVPMNEE